MDLSNLRNARQSYVQALCEQLRGTGSRYQRLTYDIWEGDAFSASVFLAELMFMSKEVHASDQEQAEGILSAGGTGISVAHLESRSLVQYTMGHLYVPDGVRNHIRHPRWISPDYRTGEELLVDTLDLREVEALRSLLDAKKSQGEFLHWVSRDNLDRHHERHKAAHPETPELDQLVPQSSRKVHNLAGADGYLLSFRRLGAETLWTPLISRTFANFWAILQSRITASADSPFHRWFRMNLAIGHRSDPGPYLTHDLRQRLLEACYSAIETVSKPSTAAKEFERVSWEYPVTSLSASFRAQAQAPSSLLEWYHWYLELRFGDEIAHSSSYLDQLVTLTVANESHIAPGRFLHLLSNAPDRPHLLPPILQSLLGKSRILLAAVIVEPSTSEIGMELLPRLSIKESETALWREQHSRTLEVERKRTALWENSLRLFLGTLDPRSPRLQDSLQSLAHLMLNTAKATLRGRSDALDEISAEKEKRWQLLLQQVSALGAPELSKIRKRLLETIPLPLPLQQNRPSQSNSSNFHLPEFRILFWLAQVAAPAANNDKDRFLRIAGRILDLYGNEIKKLITGNDRVIHWVDDMPDALSLPWSDFASSLVKNGRLDRLLDPFGNSLGQFANNYPGWTTNPSEPQGKERLRLLQQIILRKIRLHLRILLLIHDAFRSKTGSSITLTGEQRTSALESLQDRIYEIVVTFAASDRGISRPSLFEFDRQFSFRLQNSPPPQISLLDSLLKEFPSFPLALQDRFVGKWMEKENDPNVLLSILSQKFAPKLLDSARTRLDALDIGNILNRSLWIPELITMAEGAVQAGHIALAEKVIAHGDSTISGQKRRDWDKSVFVMRLMMSYLKNDEEAIQNQPQPSGQGGDPTEFENSRRFYLALTLLRRDPEKSFSIFKGLSINGSHNHAYLINAFAARLSAASNISSPLKLQEEMALIWEEFNPPGNAIPEAASRSRPYLYNRLLCLDGARLDLLFDAEWATIDDPLKLQIDFLSIGVCNASRRGLKDRERQLLLNAKPYNITSKGEASKDFEQLEKGFFISPPPARESHDRLYDPAESRNSFLEASNGPAHLIPLIFGEENQSLEDYLWSHLVAAAREFLLRASIFKDVKMENSRNDAISSFMRRSLAFLRTWEVPDQSRGGMSQGGKDAGARDWTVRTQGGELAIFEALNLTSIDSDYLNAHLEKLISAYDPEGKPISFIVVYYEGQNFSGFWKRYLEHVKQFPLRAKHLPQSTESNLHDLSIAGGSQEFEKLRGSRQVYDLNGYSKAVHHLAIHIPEKP